MLTDTVQLLLAQASPYTVGSGRIQGGWGYVWASYGLTWGGVVLYALTLWLRRKAASERLLRKEP